MIERVHALATVEEIAVADPRMIAIVLGTEDLSVQYGYRLDRTGCGLETLYLKSRCILAARLAGIDCIDSAYFHYRDLEGTRRAPTGRPSSASAARPACRRARSQSSTRPSCSTAAEIEWATEVLEALDKAATENLSVAVAGGMMVDAPHAQQARSILEQAGAREPEAEP